MFATDVIFGQQEILVDNQKCQAGLRPLCNKIPFLLFHFPYLYANIWDGKQATTESILILTDRKIFFDFSDT